VHLELRRSQKLKTTNLPQILLQLAAGVEQRGHLALLLISTNFNIILTRIFCLYSRHYHTLLKKENVKNSRMLLCLSSLSCKSYLEIQRKLHMLLT
jgi:hypothetical protein